MKTYYIRYPRNFGNEYSLCYCESADERKAAEADGWERITRLEAERKCRNENWARANDPAFSGYGDNTIIPFRLVGKDIDYYYGRQYDKFHLMLAYGKDRYILNGYIFEKEERDETRNPTRALRREEHRQDMLETEPNA